MSATHVYHNLKIGFKKGIKTEMIFFFFNKIK